MMPPLPALPTCSGWEVGYDRQHRPAPVSPQEHPAGRTGSQTLRRVVAGQSKIFVGFRDWLTSGGYSDSAVKQYSAAARLALGLLDKPHAGIDLEADFDRVRSYLAQWRAPSTQATYHKGLAKLADYLRYCRNQPPPPPAIHWDAYLASFPAWLADDIRAYLNHRRRVWLPEGWHSATLNLLSHLTATLRALTGDAPLTDLTELTPARWDDYVDQRLAAGRKPATLNRELYDLQGFLRFLADRGRPVCERMLAVTPLDTPDPLPRDVPVPQLRRLQEEIQAEAATTERSSRYKGVMDRAWFLLMLNSGLRIGEIRRLRLDDLDLDNRQVRVRQSKGLQDRMVYLSPAGVEALKAYLAIRGPAVNDYVFIYRHKQLSSGYCNQRLRVYGQQCSLHVTAHQLRYSMATLILNAGLPVLTLQHLLGHQRVETTLRYARLYDSTVAQDYRRAMVGIEDQSTEDR